MEARKTLFDLLAGAGLLYAAVCVYELGNYVAMYALGFSPTISFGGGLLPVGVSAVVSNAQALVFAKPVQIALSVSLMLGAFFLARSHGLNVTKTVALGMASVYLASCYWEVLSAMGSIGYGLHVLFFTILAIGAQFGLSRALKA